MPPVRLSGVTFKVPLTVKVWKPALAVVAPLGPNVRETMLAVLPAAKIGEVLNVVVTPMVTISPWAKVCPGQAFVLVPLTLVQLAAVVQSEPVPFHAQVAPVAKLRPTKRSIRNVIAKAVLINCVFKVFKLFRAN